VAFLLTCTDWTTSLSLPSLIEANGTRAPHCLEAIWKFWTIRCWLVCSFYELQFSRMALSHGFGWPPDVLLPWNDWPTLRCKCSCRRSSSYRSSRKWWLKSKKRTILFSHPSTTSPDGLRFSGDLLRYY